MMENSLRKWLFLHERQPLMCTYYLVYLVYEDDIKSGTVNGTVINNIP